MVQLCLLYEKFDLGVPIIAVFDLANLLTHQSLGDCIYGLEHDVGVAFLGLLEVLALLAQKTESMKVVLLGVDVIYGHLMLIKLTIVQSETVPRFLHGKIMHLPAIIGLVEAYQEGENFGSLPDVCVVLQGC